jgi:hypothetical protein
VEKLGKGGGGKNKTPLDALPTPGLWRRTKRKK